MGFKWAYLYVLLTVLMSLLGCQKDGSSPSSGHLPVSKGEVIKPVEKKDDITEVLDNGVVFELSKLVPLSRDLSNVKEFKQNLNRYKVQISIPESVFVQGGLEIRRSLDASSFRPIYEKLEKYNAQYINGKYVLIDNLDSIWRPREFSPKKLTYKIYIDGVETTESFKPEELYPDFIIEGKRGTSIEYNSKDEPIPVIQTLKSYEMASAIYKFGVLLLEENATLRTEGYTVTFIADRFISYGEIETFAKFPEEAKAMSGVDAELYFYDQPMAGQHGGKITIKAREANGLLKVYLRGGDGAKGQNAPEQTGIGQVGDAGLAGELEQICEGPIRGPHRLRPLMYKGACHSYCAKNPTSGAQGGQGPKGHKGYKGQRGGNSGSIEIEIAQESDLKVYYRRVAGKGGAGGDGSDGGKGGAGGPAGSTPRGCNAASVGPEGLRGEKGDSGDQGEDGVLEDCVLMINHIKREFNR